MKITFIGAAQEVTGSKHLITTNKGKRILLDCGMFQGKGLETDQLNRELRFDPKQLDYVLLSHAHIDHSGLIPYLYKKGFRGSVICTHATRDLCAIMLADSAYIQELDAKWYNKKAARKGLPFIQPIYNLSHAEQSMELFISVPYGRRFYINDEISVKFTNTGHMLGSAAINLQIKEENEIKRITYTGDIGRPHNRILKAPEPFLPCDYLITESTYGNRTHEATEATEQQFLQVVRDTCIQRRGKLIIPSFSIGRTQEIVYILNKLYNQGDLPEYIDVFVDSPLSVNATEIFRLYADSMNEYVKQTMITDKDPFGFNSLHYIKDQAESKALNSHNKPCIIISASGMLEAGRIKHHVSNNISNPRNTILIVGYCTPTSLGARLQRKGLREVSIFGIPHQVKAQIIKIDGLSGHADYQEMMQYISCQPKENIKHTFLVHGDYEAECHYKTQLHEAGWKHVSTPAPGDEFEL